MQQFDNILNVKREFIVGLYVASSFLATQSGEAQENTGVQTENDPDTALIQPQIFPMSNLDTDNNGLLDLDVPEITLRPGSTIYFENDGSHQVETGNYLVPSNRVYVDYDNDGLLETQPIYSRIVVVLEDNLTYLFDDQDPDKLIGVFPNGTGRAGANSVASLRRINAILGRAWGAEYSQRAGYEANMFGDITLATEYVISGNPGEDIDTFQELHGTPEHLEFLLGTTISGGCIRHSNDAINLIRNRVGVGDYVLTLVTAEDDHFDSQTSIFGTTRVAANQALPDYSASQLNVDLVTREIPRQMVPLSEDQPTWVPIQLFPGFEDWYVGHPYTRAQYDRIPCGLETVYITARLAGRHLVHESSDGFELLLPEFVNVLNDQTIPISTFYTRPELTRGDLAQQAFNFSSGDIQAQAFQALMWDFAYQYAEYVVQRDYSFPELSQTELDRQVSSLNQRQLREVQQVTGLIPVRYSETGHVYLNSVGDRYEARFNRTLVEKVMQLFDQQPGSIYELDFRYDLSSQAFLTQDLPIDRPSLDHEVFRIGNGVSLESLLSLATAEQRQVIFRISNYRIHTESLSYQTDLSAAHYFAFLPDISNLDEGQVAVYDTMHPNLVLMVPIDRLASLFSTMVVSQ